MTPAIGLADLIRAVAQLFPRGDDPDAIARILGWGSIEAATTGTAAATATTTGAAAATGTAAATAERPTTGSGTTTAGRSQLDAPTRTIEHGPVSLRPLGRPESAPPPWLPPPSSGLDLTLAPGEPSELETLFEPRRHRALISAAAATFDDAGPLDLERLIEQITTYRLPRALPRLPEASLRRGAWLLLDRSPAMMPFYDDVTELAARIVRVVGRDATRVQQFTAHPDRVWDPARFQDRALALPPPGTPLVLLTALGVRSGARGWQPLLLRLTARGSSAIAVVPYPVARIPDELRRLATLIAWGRSTKVGAVRPRRRRAR